MMTSCININKGVWSINTDMGLFINTIMTAVTQSCMKLYFYVIKAMFYQVLRAYTYTQVSLVLYYNDDIMHKCD